MSLRYSNLVFIVSKCRLVVIEMIQSKVPNKMRKKRNFNI